MRTAPEEVRVSLYVRDRAAEATENRGGDLRWFNEAQANRMLFPFGFGNTGRSDNVYYTMVTPLNNLSQWNNWFGLGIASGSAENTADFLDTVNSIDELRFQFDSSFYGLGGFGLNENQTGTFSIDRFLSVARGDANLDGVIDTNDTLIVLANQGTGTVWQQGDFTGDGLVNGLDLAFVPAIPEPSSLALLTGAALLGLRRRR